MKISMFSTHEMKYIWYLLKKVNFLFILYFFRRFTVNQFVNHASSRITKRPKVKEDKEVCVTEHLDQSTCRAGEGISEP